MVRYVTNSKTHARKNPIRRRNRILGDLQAKSYALQKRIREAKQKRRTAARLESKATRLKRSWRWRRGHSAAEQLELQAHALRSAAKKITPPRKKRILVPKKAGTLLQQLARAQNISAQWVSILGRLQREKKLTISKKTNLRETIVSLLNLHNPAAAAHFAKGGSVILQSGTMPLETKLRNARTKVRVMPLEMQRAKERTRSYSPYFDY